MEARKFVQQRIFQGIIPSIETICTEMNVDDTHGLAHALKIVSLTEKALQFEQLDQQSY
jgi:hypothetical protein